MAVLGEEAFVDGDNDYISDDSSFYGDDNLRQSLSELAEAFDPATYWPTHALRIATIAATASAKAAAAAASTTTNAQDLYNPYADLVSCRQLSEPVSAFLARLPPSSTQSTSIGSPWIRIANARSPRRATAEDWAGFTAAGTQLLETFSSKKAELEASMVGKAKGTLTRKLNPLRQKLETDLLAAARERGCTTGKWMLFPPLGDVDSVWGEVATGTAEGELGVAAKVAAREGEGEVERGEGSLVCVYTKDFADSGDVKRVLLALKGMGLLRDEGRGIYYKCDAFTHLGINSGNEWGLKASFHSSKAMLSDGEKR